MLEFWGIVYTSEPTNNLALFIECLSPGGKATNTNKMVEIRYRNIVCRSVIAVFNSYLIRMLKIRTRIGIHYFKSSDHF